MSSHNNQQRRLARRFKRTMQAQQRHQRGSVVRELASILGIAALMVLAFVIAHQALQTGTAHIYDYPRIDWENVPVYPPATFCDLRAHLPRTPACITSNQATFARERKRVYAALAFERTR